MVYYVLFAVCLLFVACCVKCVLFVVCNCYSSLLTAVCCPVVSGLLSVVCYCVWLIVVGGAACC